MTVTPRRTPRSFRPNLGFALVAAVFAASLAPAAAVGSPGSVPPVPDVAPAAPPADPPGDPGVLPSVHYEEAVAHANDRIEFKPGGRVTVGFSPRPDDRWTVGGRKPRALPAGRATGLEMARSAVGTVWAGEKPTPAGDKPTPAGGGQGGSPASPPPAAPTEPDASEAPAPSPDASSPAPSSETPASPAPSADEPAGATPSPSSPPIDLPSVDPASVIDATSSSLALDAPDDGPELTADTAAARREVFGFLPYWELDSGLVLNYDLLTTIAFFSVGADANGNLDKAGVGWSGWTSSRMTDVINAAHRKGVRVVLTVAMFAWTDSQRNRQKALLGNPTARLNLARQAAAAVRDRGADGVNLDFEPIASGYDDEFVAFVRTLRQELDRIAPGYQLTFDTTGYIGNYPIAEATAPGGADAVFIMGYDYRTAGASRTGSISPLSGPAYDLTDTVNAFAAKVHPSKLILGVPYYGRAWSTTTDQLNAPNVSGTKYGASVTAIYTTAAELAAENGRRWDPVEQTPWTAYRRTTCTSTYGCVDHWRQLYYDDATSLRAKYDLVIRKGLRGAGIWALGYDGTRPELNQALEMLVGSVPTTRLAGSDRYATAAAVSRTYTPGVPVAFVATGADFPDALAGAAAAAKLGGPVLLVSRNGIPSSTAAELTRLKPDRIVVLGSSAVVSSGVASALTRYTSGGVTRLAGADRYATAAAVSKATFPAGVPVAYVATGQSFPDGLAAAAAAGESGGPLLLVTRTAIPSSVATELRRLRPGRIVVVGSASVVSDGVANALRGFTSGGVTRLAGQDRYATAARISAATFEAGVPVVYVATGTNFPDALAGAASAGLEGGPLLLVRPTALPDDTKAELARLKPERVVILGSSAVVSESVAVQVRIAAGGS